MYRNLFRTIRLNFWIYLAFSLFAVAVQSTVFGYYPLRYLQPDLILILMVYMGFKRILFEGGVFAILAATIIESHSSAGNHYFLTTYLYVFLISNVLRRTVIIPDMLSSIGIVSAMTVLKKVGILILLGVEGRAVNGLRAFLVFLIPGLIVQAFLTPALFSLFHFIDLKTFKDAHSEDEYDINKGF